MFQNNETVAMLVHPENPLGVELFCHVNTFFCSNKLHAGHVSENALLVFNKRLEFDFFKTPTKFPTCTSQENLQHLHITTEKNLTSNHCLKLKSLGFSVLKYIVFNVLLT